MLKKLVGELKEWFFCICVAGIILVCLNYFCWPCKINGISMEDTYKNKSIVFTSQYLASKSINKNDVVLIKHSLFEEVIIKRVIAISGDTVEIYDNKVSVNGEPIAEPYTKGVTKERLHLIVDEGSVFVLGDNRENSIDSRSLGLISLSCIVAKVIEF